VRLLDRLRIEPRRLELHPLAGEVHHRLRPQAAHDLEELVAARAAILPAVAAGLHLLLVPAHADAEVDPPLGEPVQVQISFAV